MAKETIDRSEIEELVKVAVLANDVEWIKKNAATREDVTRIEGEVARIKDEMAQVRETMATREDVTRIEGEMAQVRETMATREDLSALRVEMSGVESRLTRKFAGWFIGFATFLLVLYGALLSLVVMIWQKLP